MRLFILVLLILAFASPAESESGWVPARSGAGQMRLVSEWKVLDSKIGEIKMGLEFKLAKGWHTFAPNPGSSIGYPPKLKWHLPEGWKASPLFYPQSKALKIKNPLKPTEEMELQGYENSVTYLMVLSGPALQDQSFKMQLKVNYLVCNVQCVPEHAEMAFILPIQDKFQPSSENKRLNHAFDELPAQESKTEPQDQTPSTGESTLHLSFIIFLAFLGGLILNLMPCVLPVIGIKTFQLIKLSPSERSKTRSSLIYTVLGIVVSFEVLAILLLSLRNLGYQLGWGFQFQNPIFLIFMMLVLTVFALNLLGIFEFKNLPASVASPLSKLKGPFWEGALATLLATPCTAPFLGTALGYSLTQSAPSTLLIFLSMSLGLSFPYLILFASPQLLRHLPKPGPWMNWMKKVLAVLLLGSAVWLGTVLSHLVSTESQPSFSEAQIQSRIEAGDKLFIDITADWCLTCKYNEVSVLNSAWFKEELLKRKISLIIVDWTQPSDEISKFLEKNGRRGIPFSMLWSKQNKILLPELLSRSNVMQALDMF